MKSSIAYVNEDVPSQYNFFESSVCDMSIIADSHHFSDYECFKHLMLKNMFGQLRIIFVHWCESVEV